MTDSLTVRDESLYEGNAAFWVRIIREHRDRYRTELTDQAILTAIGDVHGLDVLDAGCGEGYLTREIARHGARQATGIDKSPALIAAARAESAGQPGVEFTEADIASLPVPSASVNLVVVNHVLNDLPDINRPLGELARVLRSGGRLAVLMLHPCFYGHRAERQAIKGTMPVTDYFSKRRIEQPFEVDGIVSPDAVINWVRPLEDYTRAITGNGLAITSVTEPHPSEEQVAASTWWQENFPRPLFLLITAAKLAL
jgi:SAM-dependent methyltransferase